MKKVISVFLSVLFLCSGAALATEDVEQIIVPFRADEYFSTYSITLTPLGGGAFRIAFSTCAVETSAIVGVSSFDIQRMVNGNWVTVVLYEPGSTDTDTFSHASGRSFYGIANSDYRVYARHYCKKYDGTSRTIGQWTGTITPY